MLHGGHAHAISTYGKIHPSGIGGEAALSFRARRTGAGAAGAAPSSGTPPPAAPGGGTPPLSTPPLTPPPAAHVEPTPAATPSLTPPPAARVGETTPTAPPLPFSLPPSGATPPPTGTGSLRRVSCRAASAARRPTVPPGDATARTGVPGSGVRSLASVSANLVASADSCHTDSRSLSSMSFELRPEGKSLSFCGPL